jgi:hypothetical protein
MHTIQFLIRNSSHTFILIPNPIALVTIIVFYHPRRESKWGRESAWGRIPLETELGFLGKQGGSRTASYHACPGICTSAITIVWKQKTKGKRMKGDKTCIIAERPRLSEEGRKSKSSGIMQYRKRVCSRGT